MSSRAFVFMVAVAGLSVLGAPMVKAQSSRSGPQQADVSWHHQMLYRIMKDMTEEMGRMTEEMARNDLTAEQRKRMERMAALMRRMSGSAARPAMADADSQRQMEEMRREMDAMMRDARMTPETK